MCISRHALPTTDSAITQVPILTYFILLNMPERQTVMLHSLWHLSYSFCPKALEVKLVWPLDRWEPLFLQDWQQTGAGAPHQPQDQMCWCAIRSGVWRYELQTITVVPNTLKYQTLTHYRDWQPALLTWLQMWLHQRVIPGRISSWSSSPTAQQSTCVPTMRMNLCRCSRSTLLCPALPPPLHWSLP